MCMLMCVLSDQTPISEEGPFPLYVCVSVFVCVCVALTLTVIHSFVAWHSDREPG